MNREERRHPDKRRTPKGGPPEQEFHPADKPQDEASPRAKSSRHKKMTADKWNQ